MKKNILIVEDEKRIRDIIKDYFIEEGINCFEASNGEEGLEVFSENKIDLVILDIMMPKVDGWSVCRRIRKHSSVPIIFLTARSEEEDKLMGYEFGADDYIEKPFSTKVLVAKAKNLLKRVEGSIGSVDNVIQIDGIKINRNKYSVSVDGLEKDLAPKEFELLWYLMENNGIALSRDKILNNVWGYDYFGEDRVVDTHIKKIRKKMEDKASYIKTVVKYGYKFEVKHEK